MAVSKQYRQSDSRRNRGLLNRLSRTRGEEEFCTAQVAPEKVDHPRLCYRRRAASSLRRAAWQPPGDALRDVRYRMGEGRMGPGSPHRPENGGLRIIVFEHDFEPETL
jgi:hypothetical protein